MRQLSAAELRDYLALAQPPPVLVDVREPWEYETVHLPGSVLIPLADIPAQLAALDPQQEIVMVCHHGIRSQQAALFLEHHGFSRVSNLQGGIDAWARDVDSSLPVY